MQQFQHPAALVKRNKESCDFDIMLGLVATNFISNVDQPSLLQSKPEKSEVDGHRIEVAFKSNINELDFADLRRVYLKNGRKLVLEE